MKLTSATLLLLKNFSTINPGIVIKPGSVISTMDPNKTVLAKARVKETFEKECAISNLPRFLGVLSFISDPDLEFEDEHLVLKTSVESVKFRYGTPSLIAVPPNKGITVTEDVKFRLLASVFSNIMKAQGAMQLKEVAVTGNDEGVFLSTLDFKNKTGDSYSVRVADSNGHNFTFLFNPSNLKFISDDYDVVLSSKGLMYLKNLEGNLEYWVPAEKDSTFT